MSPTVSGGRLSALSGEGCLGQPRQHRGALAPKAACGGQSWNLRCYEPVSCDTLTGWLLTAATRKPSQVTVGLSARKWTPGS